MKIKLVTIAVILASSTTFARPVCSGDVMGRDMIFPIVGRIGHLGIATGDDVYYPTNLTIEVEPNGDHSIIWGKVSEFRTKTRYWGSRGGLIMDTGLMFKALNEAKKQSFWCPHYAPAPVYDPGTGWFDAISNPHPTHCATFRCDSFVGYVMAFGGAPQIKNNKIQLPYNAFMTLPFSNFDAPRIHSEEEDNVTAEVPKDKFLKFTVSELNAMDMEAMTPFLNTNGGQESPEITQKKWKLISDEEAKELWRWVFIDEMSMSKNKDTISHFMRIYPKVKSEFVKTKIIVGVMRFYQNNWDAVKASPDFETIKSFYERLIKEKADKERSPDVVRGFVDFHSDKEVSKSLNAIEKHLSGIDKRSLMGLQFEIIRKSPELQKMFLPKTISALRKANDSELDSMAFYYLNHGVVLADDKSKKMLKAFILERKEIHRTLQDDIQSYHAKYAEKDMDELLKKLN